MFVYLGVNSDYVELMYESWTQDHSSVHASWDAFFKTGEFVDTSGSQTVVYYPSGDGKSNDSVRILSLIRAYQVRTDITPLYFFCTENHHLKLIFL